MDTIAAIATAPGAGGVGVIRISGEQSLEIARQLTQKDIPEARKAFLRSFYSHDQQNIDHGLVLYFQSPASYTGEDVVELQGHGGPVVLQMLLKRVIDLGARQARPGEFTERAFLNDRMDLAQAEAVADLIEGQSESAVRAASRSLQGQFSEDVKKIQYGLTQLRIWVEAAIDFPEEEIDFLADPQLLSQAKALNEQFGELKQRVQQGRLLRDGFNLVLIGAPNAGKSSLLNRLSGQDTAIVTEVAGTTRDVLREHLLIEGIPVHVSDTAGLRITDDVVEAEGIRRAIAEIQKADIAILIEDVTQPVQIPDDIELPKSLIYVHNKIDQSSHQPRVDLTDNTVQVYLSVKEGLGVELLMEQIFIKLGVAEHSEGSYSARQRHINAIERAQQFLQDGLFQLQNYSAGELMAEDLRQAQLALSEITGEFSNDDLLGEIFSNFCIGK